LKTVRLERKSLRVTDDVSNDLKLCEGVERSVAGSRMRKAVPPPTMWDFVALELPWAADKSESRRSGIEEFGRGRCRGYPGFSESKEVNMT